MFALAMISVVLFGFQVWINNVQTLPSDFFPKSAVGSIAGLGGTGAGIGSIIFIYTTGWVVDHFSYTPILVCGGLACADWNDCFVRAVGQNSKGFIR